MKTFKKKNITNDPFADTLHVRKLSTETITNRLKSNHDRKLKMVSCSILEQNKDFEPSSQLARIESSEFNYSKEMKKRTSINETKEVQIPGRLRKAQLSSNIKMIPMLLPKFGGSEAIVLSNLKNSTNSIHYNDHQVKQNSALIIPETLLEDARNEIDISQNQLKRIHSILKNSNVEENESVQPKWNLPVTHSSKKVNSKQKVLRTLNTLNKKLNDMQDKYFNESKASYRSIKDITSKMKIQSESDIDINESHSNSNHEVLNKEDLLKKFFQARSEKVHKIMDVPNNMFISKNDFSHLHVPEMQTKSSSMTKYQSCNDLQEQNSTGNLIEDVYLKFTESRSDADIPPEAKKRILEKFHLTKASKIPSEIRRNKYPTVYRNDRSDNFLDKGQTFVSDIPDILIENVKSSNTFFGRSFNDSKNTNGSDCALLECYSDAITEFNREQMENIKNKLFKKKPMRTVISNDNKKYGKPIPIEKNVLAISTSSSDPDYHDCNSNMYSSNHSSTKTNKKIFFDNFKAPNLGQKEKEKIELNKTPNLISQSSSTWKDLNEKILDGSELQQSVLNSDFLTKSFTMNPSGAISEVHQTPIQGSNFSLDLRTNGNEKLKNLKSTKEMYSALTKALSNSFYTLSPPS